MRLEKHLIDFFVLIDYALLLAWQVQFPGHKHGIGVGDVGFKVFVAESVDP